MYLSRKFSENNFFLVFKVRPESNVVKTGLSMFDFTAAKKIPAKWQPLKNHSTFK